MFILSPVLATCLAIGVTADNVFNELYKRSTRGVGARTVDPTTSLDIAYSIAAHFPAIQTLFTANNAVTAFAPTDQAFANLKAAHPAYYRYVFSSDATLLHFAKYHILLESYQPATLMHNRSFHKTWSHERLRIDVDFGKVTAGSGNGNNASVTQSIVATNGFIYAVDNVLVPPKPFATALAWKGLTTYAAYVAKPNAFVWNLNQLHQSTFFAPTNAAFATVASLYPGLNLQATLGVISSVVDFHITNSVLYNSDLEAISYSKSYPTGLHGNNITIYFDGLTTSIAGAGNTISAKIVESDILLVGGSVLHTIDMVLLPSSYALAAAATTNLTIFPAF
eukprot:jgi/Hompol1/6983/HPOL_005146-RA